MAKVPEIRFESQLLMWPW